MEGKTPAFPSPEGFEQRISESLDIDVGSMDSAVKAQVRALYKEIARAVSPPEYQIKLEGTFLVQSQNSLSGSKDTVAVKYKAFSFPALSPSLYMVDKAYEDLGLDPLSWAELKTLSRYSQSSDLFVCHGSTYYDFLMVGGLFIPTIQAGSRSKISAIHPYPEGSVFVGTPFHN